ncbi:MAG: response regulator [Nisaea sp.]|uniref:response regulator n=1 Tax=Nisaea sp. TaxID=2024842 RepID=UPI0032651E38
MTRRHYDLIVTDLEMQPMNGWDMLRRIRHDPDITTPYVLVVLTTQHASRDPVIRARDDGASALVAKPVDFKKSTADNRDRAYRRQDKLPQGDTYQREDDFRW